MRRVRDSNPGYRFQYASFQDWCIQPLYQLSVLISQYIKEPNKKSLDLFEEIQAF